ncbi:MAG: SRPBCC family protein [Flavobacteriales bacterium]
MIVEAQVTINGTKAAVWAALTNIENAAQIISGIDKVEVIEKPANGIIGLRWRETRMLFGKPATVEKRVIAGAENEFYTTEARDGGFLFTTYHRIADHEGPLILRSIHETKPQGFMASLKAIPMIFFKGMIKKAILQDLNDTKSVVERG